MTEKNIVPAVLEALRAVLERGDVTYTVKRADTEKNDPGADTLKAQLQKLDLKEKRAKEAYMDGIDTKDEYRMNRLLLKNERENLEKALELINQELETSGDDLDSRMLSNIHTVLDLSLIHI